MGRYKQYVLTQRMIKYHITLGNATSCRLCGEPVNAGELVLAGKGSGNYRHRFYHIDCARRVKLLA